MKKTHCVNGHEFSEENTIFRPNGWRVCRECKRMHDKKQRERPGATERSRARSKAWRDQNPERSRQLGRNHYYKIREIIESAKDVPCQDCGISYPHYVMDFDHTDPTQKTMNVGATRSLKRTLEEIAKCDVVCSNCHRIRTWKEESDGRKEQNNR